jgi:sugar lactone lactonase YvrE
VRSARIFHEGLHFGEGPRWHEGRLWYSDFFDHAVHAIDAEGEDERVLELDGDGRPSGLGWMPDGTMLVVSMLDRKVLRWDGTSLKEHADLSGIATFHCNDMVVDSQGRAYVGNFGFDLHGGGAPGPATMARVDPDGSVHVAAEDLMFPNGTVITPDGRTLIVGESFAARLTAFDVSADGTLSNRRVWAQVADAVPDGICLDAEGAVWIANPLGTSCLRIAEGGEVLDEVGTSTNAFACMLGGADGRELYILTAPDSSDDKASAARDGRIEVVTVDVPHAGLP